MWTDYYLRAESEEAFLAALPEGWKNEDGSIRGSQEGIALDVIGPVESWYLVNLRLTFPLPEALEGMAIPMPEFPKRVFA